MKSLYPDCIHCLNFNGGISSVYLSKKMNSCLSSSIFVTFPPAPKKKKEKRGDKGSDYR